MKPFKHYQQVQQQKQQGAKQMAETKPVVLVGDKTGIPADRLPEWHKMLRDIDRKQQSVNAAQASYQAAVAKANLFESDLHDEFSIPMGVGIEPSDGTFFKTKLGGSVSDQLVKQHNEHKRIQQETQSQLSDLQKQIDAAADKLREAEVHKQQNAALNTQLSKSADIARDNEKLRDDNQRLQERLTALDAISKQ